MDNVTQSLLVILLPATLLTLGMGLAISHGWQSIAPLSDTTSGLRAAFLSVCPVQADAPRWCEVFCPRCSPPTGRLRRDSEKKYIGTMSRNNAIRIGALVIQAVILLLMVQAFIPPVRGGLLILAVGFVAFFLTRDSSGKKSGQ